MPLCHHNDHMAIYTHHYTIKLNLLSSDLVWTADMWDSVRDDQPVCWWRTALFICDSHASQAYCFMRFIIWESHLMHAGMWNRASLCNYLVCSGPHINITRLTSNQLLRWEYVTQRHACKRVRVINLNKSAFAHLYRVQWASSSSGGRVLRSSGVTAEPFSSTPSERSFRMVT